LHADQLLIDDHNRLRDLLGRLEATSCDDANQRRQLLNELTRELSVHVRLEDELFYPAVRNVSPLIAISLSEHRQIDDRFAAALRTDPTSPRFAIELSALKAQLDQHAGEEEREMFPQAQALGEAKLEALGQQMQARQQQLRRSKLARFRVALKREILRHT